MFEYADEWLGRADAFALDLANLPLERRPFYTGPGKSALPGALRDTRPTVGGSI